MESRAIVEGSKALQAFRTGSVSCGPHERAIMAMSDRGGAATAVSLMRGRSHRTRILARYAAHSPSQLPWLNETPNGGGISCCPSEPKETPLERFIRRLQLRFDCSGSAYFEYQARFEVVATQWKKIRKRWSNYCCTFVIMSQRLLRKRWSNSSPKYCCTVTNVTRGHNCLPQWVNNCLPRAI